MSRLKTVISLLILFFLLILSCSFNPFYDDNSIKNGNNVRIIIENGKDIDIFGIIVSASDMQTIHFYQDAHRHELNFKVESGEDRVFTVNGYVSDSLRYTTNFVADIPEGDTTFTVTLTAVEGPVPAVPRNVVLDLLPSDVVKINWDESDIAKGYCIYRYIEDRELKDGDVIDSCKGTEFFDSTVCANHTYFYGVSAYNTTGESDISEYTSIKIPISNDIPDTPEDLKVKDVSATTVTLGWKRVLGAESYKVFRVKGSGTPNDSIATVYDLEFVDQDLDPITLYSYSVSAWNSVAESQKSSKVSTTTLAPIPDKPDNVSANALSDKIIKITWDEVEYTEEYEVYKSDKEDGTYELDGTSDINSYLSTGLVIDTRYYYKVKAKNEAGISPFSEVASAKTLDEVVEKPDKPEGLVAEELSPSAILLHWPHVQYASNYNIYRSQSATGVFNAIGSAIDTMYTDSGLQEDTWYYYKVSAENSIGESEKSEVASAKTMIFINVPTGLSGEALSTSEIELSWNSVTGADEYRVFRSMSETGTYDEIATTDQTTYTDAGLDENTTYYYKVSAKGLSGESDQTDPVDVTTKMQVPDTPDGLTATALSASEIRIDFNTVTNATGYIIYWSESASGPYDSLTSVGSGTYTHNGLNSNTEYFYKVSAYNDGGESDLSDSASATTLPAPPDPPTGVEATALSSSEIEVEYNSVSDAAGYRIYHCLFENGQYDPLDSTTQTSFTHDGLSPNTTHYYKVTAYNNDGESDLSDSDSATTKSKQVAYIRSCRGCGRCYNKCHLDAIKRSGNDYYVDTDLCDGCGECVDEQWCPYDYIEMIDAWEKIKSWFRNLLIGEKNSK